MYKQLTEGTYRGRRQEGPLHTHAELTRNIHHYTKWMLMFQIYKLLLEIVSMRHEERFPSDTSIFSIKDHG